MNKLFNKIVTLSVGLAMAICVGVAVASSGKGAEPVRADQNASVDTTISTLISDNGWEVSSGSTIKSKITSLPVNDDITITTNGTAANEGTFWGTSPNNDWRLYNGGQTSGTAAGEITISGATGCTITNYTYTYGTSNSGVLATERGNPASAKRVTSGTTVNVGASSHSLFVARTSSGTNGQVRIKRIVVNYTKAAQNVTVTFNANGHGTAPAQQTIQSGGKVTQPTAPTATGWTFGGWYKEQACTNAWNFSTDTVSTNTTLWAKWTATTYSISYTLNGGTHGTTHPTSGKYDTAFSVSAPTKTGYTFTGWTVTSGLNTSTAKWGTTSSPSTAISSSSTLCVNGTNAVYFKNINAASTAVTLTANWSINSYTVGGTISNGSLSSTANVNYNAALDIQIVPDTDYTYPSSIESVTMGGAAYAGYTYDSTDGSFYIEHVTGNVVINADCVSTSATERFFTYHLSHCSIENAPVSMYDTEMKLLQIVADDHYKFPSSITVTGISDDKWDYDAGEGTILINEPDGNIDLTVACAPKAQPTITTGTLTGVSPAGENPTSVEEGATVTLTFTANSGYGLPTSSGVTVTGTGSSFSWTQGTGQLQITGGTGNITVSIIGIRRDLTDSSLTLGTKKTSYTTGDDFELPSTVTANFNLAPLTVNVKNDVEVSGPVVKNSSKYIVTGSGTITLTYTYEPTGSSQSASYAITATPVVPSSAEYRKVTSISAGNYLMVYEDGGYAMSTTQGSNNRDSVSVTISNSKITTVPATAQVLTVSQTTIGTNTGWQFYTGSGYLYAASSSNNYLRTQTTNDANGLFTASFSGGDVTLTAQGSNTKNIIRFNTASDQLKFSCYGSNSALPVVQLYKYYPAVEVELKWITATVKSGTYYKGTSVTASNFDVIGHYNDGNTQAITSGITVTDGYLANVGANKVTLTYSGLSYEVTVNATQAPVSTLSVDPTSASIGLNENYNLSNVTVTVMPSYAINTYTWALINAGGLVEGTDYTFENDVYHSINPGTVVFRCTSTADASKFADFTLFISGIPEIHITESSFTGYAGKGDVLHFTYMNIAEDKLDRITFTSSAPSVVDLSDGPDAGSGSGTVELEYKSAGTATISVSYDGGSTLDTVSVTVYTNTVTSVTWSASNIDVYSGATLSTAGWNVKYHMASGDSGDADSYTIKLVGQTTETITAGYAFKAEDDGKTIHVEYQNVSSSSIDVKVTQTIHSVIAEIPGAATTYYQLIDSTEELEAGRYLIVSQTDNKAFDGSLSTLDAAQNNIDVIITNGTIADDSTVAGKYFDLSVNSNNWTITSASGANVGHSGTGNGMDGTGTNTISVVDGIATILGTGGKGLAYNSSSASSGERFRYYTSPASGGNHAVSLFKLTTEYGPSTPTEIANVVAHKEAQRVAVKFAKAFNAAMDKTENCTTGLDAAWTACSNAYNTFKTEAAALGETEEAYAKYYIQYATCAWSDDSGEACIERMLRTYKACVQVHGKNAFMSDLVTLSANNRINPLGNLPADANAAAIVIIVSVISAAAVGGYFFLRKKKED